MVSKFPDSDSRFLNRFGCDQYLLPSRENIWCPVVINISQLVTVRVTQPGRYRYYITGRAFIFAVRVIVIAAAT